MDNEFDRRIYMKEMKALSGWGDTWIRILEEKGKIPRGRRDVGGKRKWWPASEVKNILMLTGDKAARFGRKAA
jgi:predicted DNA-binding transcriptional regulator AlpA